ncbi:hypothetical protein SAMN05216266_10583 [Amycolatopsis marina]|uniref:Voltage-gated potassium channel n=1 Tax=Amycolatopsis marina TaxID=490629 RepID=A0A1I0YJ27_9PSEU|nr:hypothetical protein [Amycolatopsis marina]SFB12786.1 hypothetical protein SAMN05216266_10583 [Amycolatopsis marina]
MSEGEDDRDTRAQQLEERLAIPVLIAALVSVPAVFLTTTGDETTVVVGKVLNWASLAVLLSESLVLLWFSRDIVAWARTHRWKLLVTAAAVPAVVFLVGPVQILRLILSIGALRVLRAGRIFRAGRVIRRRAGLTGRRGRWLLGGVTVLAAAFVTLVLADPTSRSRHLADRILDQFGVLPAVLAGLILAVALLALIRHRRR